MAALIRRRRRITREPRVGGDEVEAALQEMLAEERARQAARDGAGV